jgi:single-strand DNA-binding protein
MNGAQVAFVGTLGRDPELRFTTGGRAVANCSMAVSRRFQRNGEWEEQTSWFNLTIWGDIGENAATSLVKGSRVMVMGRLEQRSWETEEGEKRTVIDLIVDEIGPSLRWATCQIERTQRSSGDGGYTGDNSGGSQQRSTYSEPIYGDEEPF